MQGAGLCDKSALLLLLCSIPFKRFGVFKVSTYKGFPCAIAC
jgi:hypothetical protein